MGLTSGSGRRGEDLPKAVRGTKPRAARVGRADLNQWGLTRRHEAFCQAYVLRRGNASAAARDAGYNKTGAAVASVRILRKPLVMKRIDQLIKEEAERGGRTIALVEEPETLAGGGGGFGGIADGTGRGVFGDPVRHPDGQGLTRAEMVATLRRVIRIALGDETIWKLATKTIRSPDGDQIQIAVRTEETTLQLPVVVSAVNLLMHELDRQEAEQKASAAGQPGEAAPMGKEDERLDRDILLEMLSRRKPPIAKVEAAK